MNAGMKYWLVKSEPESFSIEDFKRERVTTWFGVRNYTARNNLKLMEIGDQCIFYRSVHKPAAIAIASVVHEAYQDPTTEEIAWVAVDLEFGREFEREVSLKVIKETPELKDMALLKLSRLSVQPVTPDEFELICKMGA